MRKTLLLLLYGFILMNSWVLCFMSSGQSDSWSAAMGLSFTFLSAYFVQQRFSFELSWKDKFAALLFPALYVAASYFVLAGNGYFEKKNWFMRWFYIHVSNPTLIGFIVLALSFTVMRQVVRPANLFVFTYITLFYAYFFHIEWRAAWMGQYTRSFNPANTTGSAPQSQEPPVDYSIKLGEYAFIDPQLDTVRLGNSDGRYTLIETWSENCFPCIRAMREMPEFYQLVADRLDVYYVYENRDAGTRAMFDKIFSFKGIEDKSRIRIDVNQSFYNAAGMNAYPYFLLFDPTGKLVKHWRGYAGKGVLGQGILDILP